MERFAGEGAAPRRAITGRGAAGRFSICAEATTRKLEMLEMLEKAVRPSTAVSVAIHRIFFMRPRFLSSPRVCPDTAYFCLYGDVILIRRQGWLISVGTYLPCRTPTTTTAAQAARLAVLRINAPTCLNLGSVISRRLASKSRHGSTRRRRRRSGTVLTLK